MTDDELCWVAEQTFRRLDGEELQVSYTRGRPYIWSDGRDVHIWSDQGDDGWRESGWAHGLQAGASGVGLSVGALDEFVLMRLAELIRDGGVCRAAERAMAHHRGNGGCVALVESWEAIKAALGALERPE